MGGGFTQRRRILAHALAFCQLGFAMVAAGQAELRFERVDEQAGLSQSSVTCIVQDRRGFLWFGTRDGLNRYDGYGVRLYRHRADDSASLSDNYIYAVFEDSRGDIWAGTYATGLNRLDPEMGTVQRFVNDPADPFSLSDNGVMCMVEDHAGVLWVGTRYGGVNRYDRETGRFTRFKRQPDQPGSLSHNRARAMLVDRQGTLWVGTWGGGLNRYDARTETFVHFRHDPSNPASLPSDSVMSLAEDAYGRLWIGTWDGGLSRYDPENNQFINHGRVRQNPETPDHNLYAIYADRHGAIWLASYSDGLARFEPASETWSHFPAAEDGSGPSHPWVRAIFEDRGGVFWFGTDSGLAKVDPRKNRFVHFKSGPEPKGLSHSRVHAILEDSQRRLWIGTDGGLNLVDRRTGRTTFYRHDPDDPTSLGSDLILSAVEDEDGFLWVGTDGGGLNRFDPRNGAVRRISTGDLGVDHQFADTALPLFIDRDGLLWLGTDGGGLVSYDPGADQAVVFRHDPENPHSLAHDLVRAGCQDSRGDIWIGGMGGLNRLIPEMPGFIRYAHDPANPASLSNNTIFCFLEDRKGRFWLGTGGGLNLFDRESGSATRYGLDQGFPSQTIFAVLEDRQGMLWMSSNRGLIKFDPGSGRVRGYDVHDGLQGNEFNRFAYFRSPRGEMFFGGDRGVNAFFPNQIQDDPNPPPVVITDFLLFNQPVALQRDDPDSPLTKPIDAVDELVISHRDQVFSFEFAALHFASPEENRYAYKLDGFDKDWIETGANRRFAVYTRLNPGRYTFRVKAANQDGVWNETGTSLKLRITPPLWATAPAYALYALTIAALIAFYVYRQKKKLTSERRVNQKLRQADRIKDQILANTSHELRTPLNGIIGLAESLIDEGGDLNDPVRLREDLSMIALSGRRLSRLVNDLLDFSQMGKGKLTLALQPVNIHRKTDMVFALISPLIRGKPLQLVNAVAPDAPPVWADPDRVVQILHNLVGNAAKFTREGVVRVAAATRDNVLAITVADSGDGIETDQLARIFEPFCQADGSTVRIHGGAGLGLSIARRLARLHGGDIEAASTPGQGAVFTLILPLAERAAQGDEHAGAGLEPAPAMPGPASPSAHILIVDDDRVNRRVLSRMLQSDEFRLTEASDGPEALQQLAVHADIDLVLLDVMMPQMSGYEVCRILRRKRGPDVLPVIFLTARDQPADQVQAFEAGANDFLTKPVDKSVLQSRIKAHLNLTANRRLLRGKTDAPGPLKTPDLSRPA